MSTTGIQNYLSNVFRPIYTYDTATFTFTPKMEISNIDTYSGNVVSTFRADIGDSANNVYVGTNAGNPYNIVRDCRDVTACGYGAGSNISNVSNSVFVGSNAGNGCRDVLSVISIGTSSGAAGGASNIFIGSSTGTVGASNILIGHSMSPVNISNQIRIGYNNQIPIAADLSKNWVGLGGQLSPRDENNKVDISGNTRIQGSVGINAVPGVRTLNLNGNFRAQDASNNILDFKGDGLTLSTGGFGSVQNRILATVGSTTIGTVKRGIIHVSAIDVASSANRAAYSYFAWTTSNVTTMASSISGDTNISISGTNVQIANITSSKTYEYSITYFPLP